MTVTIEEVARRAGVSIRTVSRAINNQDELAPETRKRVLSVVGELGYRPSKLARGLVTHRTQTIGLVLGDINNPFFSELASGVIDAAQTCDYRIFVCHTHGDVENECEALRSLADHQVDGAIVYPGFGGGEVLRQFARTMPLVAVNLFFAYPGVSRVMTNTAGGSRLAVDHLVNRGHTAIAMLAGEPPTLRASRRVHGFRCALREHHLNPRPEWIVAGPPTVERGYDDARALLQRYPEITAIFAYNDLLAIGAVRACRELSRNAPDRCAVIGFDDITLARMVSPALTTVSVDKYALGRAALGRLLEMLAHPGQDFPPIYQDVALVVRESA